MSLFRFEKYFTFKDNTELISECLDCSLISATKVYGLANIVDDSLDVCMMFDDSK